MKNFKKVLAVMTASAALLTSTAFAAEPVITGDLEGSYDLETNVLDLEAVSADASTQMTILVLKEGTDVAAVEASDILYINQQGSENAFAGMGLNLDALGDDVTELPDGTYPIRVGYYASGAFAIAEGSLVISSQSGPQLVTIQLGDCAEQFGKVDLNDLNAVIGHVLGKGKLEGNLFAAADCAEQLSKIDLNDINAVIGHILGKAKLGTIQVPAE